MRASQCSAGVVHFGKIPTPLRLHLFPSNQVRLALPQRIEKWSLTSLQQRLVKTGRAEREENSIQNQEKRDMAKNNGHLTKQEQGHLNRFQNHVHNEIDHKKK
jgi:hypothetical protein